jgi:hypothetical protein
MTQEEISAYLAEVERRFRERTPAPDIEAVFAPTRVGRGEMRAWFSDTFGRPLGFDEVELAPHMKKLFTRLRKEFPEEVW